LKHPEALDFDALRFCNSTDVNGAEYFSVCAGTGSGVMALDVALMIGARSIGLYGFDMHGSHFFGPYTNGLRNTSDQRRSILLQQFDDWARRNAGVSVTNYTPGSAITRFPFGDHHGD
jgi:hypothetical protein